MNRKLELALHPLPTPGRVDTSLRYTDILFGFVIKELFLRLQNWSKLDSEVRWHLIVGTTLVLGSWIGYRRSLNRSAYEVKFFNLPFLRFILDQLMLISYFQIAVLTDGEGKTLLRPTSLATKTSGLLLYVFILYLLWDALGIWMANATDAGKPRYPRVNGKQEKTDEKQQADWAAFCITGSALVLVVALRSTVCKLMPNAVSILAVLLLLSYRVAKEVRTSWRPPQPKH